MRISDWSSDVCSSDLRVRHRLGDDHVDELADQRRIAVEIDHAIARRAASHLAATAPRRTLDENALCPADQTDRKSVVSGKRGSVRVDLDGCRIIKKKK